MTPSTLREFRRLYNLSASEAAIICGSQSASQSNAADTWRKWERGAYEIPPHVETIVTLCMASEKNFSTAILAARDRLSLPVFNRLAVESDERTARSFTKKRSETVSMEPHYIVARDRHDALHTMKKWGWKTGMFGTIQCGFNPDGHPVIHLRREYEIPVEQTVYLAFNAASENHWTFQKVKAHVVAGGRVETPGSQKEKAGE